MMYDLDIIINDPSLLIRTIDNSFISQSDLRPEDSEMIQLETLGISYSDVLTNQKDTYLSEAEHERHTMNLDMEKERMKRRTKLEKFYPQN